jgi:hypothetical protein
MEKRDVLDSRYLAITTSPIISIASTYIVFLTKMQKGGKASEKIWPYDIRKQCF